MNTIMSGRSISNQLTSQFCQNRIGQVVVCPVQARFVLLCETLGLMPKGRSWWKEFWLIRAMGCHTPFFKGLDPLLQSSSRGTTFGRITDKHHGTNTIPMGTTLHSS